MDENENPHCSASHTFSKLAANPDEIGASASPKQWTQFSGISSQVNQAAFTNLCSWNPMDLPDFTPLSEQIQVNSNPGSILSDFGVFNGSSDFVNCSQLDWHRGNASSQQFQVKEGLAGKLTDVPKKKMQRRSFDNQSQSTLQHDFQRANHVFNCDDVGLGSHLHQQMHHPSFHHTSVGLDTAGCHSQSSPSRENLLPSALRDENVLPADVTPADSTFDGRLSSDVSVENWSHVNFVDTSLPFSHSPAHQFSTHKRQSSDNFPETSHCFPDTVEDDVIAYLQMYDPLSLNLDGETKTDEHSYSNVNNTFISAEHRPYTTSRQQNLLNSNKGHSSDKRTASQSQPLRHELSSEAAFSAELLKPSYSNIAKTRKHEPAFGAKADHSNSEGSIQNPFAKTLKKDEKLFQPLGKRTLLNSKSLLKGLLGEEADQSRVSATSKYGLDSLTTQSAGYPTSSENLAKVNRRGIDNSMTNSVSGLNEINLQRDANHAPPAKNGFDPVQEVNSPVQQSIFSQNPAKPSLSSKPYSSSSQQTAPKTDLFFDPKRIFQYENKNKVHNPTHNLTSSKTTTGINESVDPSRVRLTSDTILNNGKSTASSASSKLLGNARQHDYISNNLRDTSKFTNQKAAAETGQGIKCSMTEELLNEKESRLGKTIGAHPHNRGFNSNGGNAAEDTFGDGVDARHHNSRSWPIIDRKQIEKWCSIPWSKLSHYGSICITSMLKLLIILLWIILYLVSGAIRLLIFLIGKSWAFIKSRIFSDPSETNDKKSWSSQDFLLRNVGLEENICLPATGEEAMKRLLACKGQDPYSILGLRADSTNEDIKKYYRKQAVLVHPDKNQEPGAEEAFKILGHAFEMIGEPDKRKQYDGHALEANEVEAMREFADMLSKLQTKIQEAANTMPCDNCKGKHRRVPVERPVYYARFCERCNTRHSAKEGDVWAESTMLGFYWHYFALMDGHVFDITEWMKCHKEYFSHMKANSHTVMYKIATEGNRRSRHQQGESGLEDLINQLFKSTTTPNGRPPHWPTSHPGSEKSSAPGWTHEASATTTAASAAAKKSRRNKKKRH